jgi:uncharacterized protein involved in exopolysaccharide biosynthesis
MAYEPAPRDRPPGSRQRNGNGNGNGHGPYNGADSPPTANEQVRDILHVIFKRKRLIAALFLAIALPGLIASAMRRPVYIATAKVMISTQRTDPTVQPTDVTKLETVQLNESLVNSEVHVINSRDLLERVVRALASAGDGAGPPHVEAGSRPFGQQIMGLSAGLSITPVKASNVIQIDYRSPDPSTAARLINRIVDEYMAYHAAVHGNKGLSRFYDEQRRDLELRLQRAEDALIGFSENEGVVSPKSEIEATVRMAGEVTSSLRDVGASIAGAEERIRVIRDQIASQPEVVKRSQYLTISPVITQLSKELVDRQVDRVALLRKYTEKDRHVRDNAEEITEIRSELEEQQRDHPTIVSQQMYRVNPLREERLRTLLDLESSLREMRARQATLDEDLSRANRRLLLLQQKSVEYDRLEQEVKNRRETYELYVKREQEARISQAMDEQKLVNVDVVQRPALPLPISGTQRVSAVLSIIAGLVVGLAGAFGSEYMSRSLRSEYDVGHYLGLPLLASIGEVPKA